MFDSHHPLDMLPMQPKQQQHRVSLLMYSRGKLVGLVVVLMGDIHFGKLLKEFLLLKTYKIESRQ